MAKTLSDHTVVCPPTILTAMTGVEYVRIYASGLTRLYYTDETTEEATLTLARLTQGRENFFALVSAVQDYRRRN